jgi:hypothetical protein
MATTRADVMQPLDSKTGERFSAGTSRSAYEVGNTALSVMDALGMQAQGLQPTPQDPFMYYKAFLDTDAPSTIIRKDNRRDDDSYTSHLETIGVEAGHNIGHQQQLRARAIPYHLAVRLANRSNGAPLATIVEQGSYSTLNSRGSLLSMGRIPSLRVAENYSPSRTAHRVSRSLDNYALQRIQEDAHHEHHPTAAVKGFATVQESGPSHPIFDPALPITSSPSELPRSPGNQISDGDRDTESRRSKGFFRGVLQNVWAASRTRSRSSSMTHAPPVEAREDQRDTSGLNRHCRMPTHILEKRPSHFESRVQHPTSSAASTPVADCQARNRKISLTNSPASASASTYPPLLESSLPLFEQDFTSNSVPQLLPPSSATHSRERSSSVRLVPQEPRDVAHNDGTNGASTLSNNQHHDNTVAQYMFNGVPVPQCSASSLNKHDCARETSRNASFCSTMSTSYSGTVLGVDLDLQYETPHQTRHSSSPMPV